MPGLPEHVKSSMQSCFLSHLLPTMLASLPLPSPDPAHCHRVGIRAKYAARLPHSCVQMFYEANAARVACTGGPMQLPPPPAFQQPGYPQAPANLHAAPQPPQQLQQQPAPPALASPQPPAGTPPAASDNKGSTAQAWTAHKAGSGQVCAIASASRPCHRCCAAC